VRLINVHFVMQGFTVLMWAADYDNETVVEIILKAGADVNATSNKVCTGAFHRPRQIVTPGWTCSRWCRLR
jgi:ankyrin repeat protein